MTELNKETRARYYAALIVADDCVQEAAEQLGITPANKARGAAVVVDDGDDDDDRIAEMVADCLRALRQKQKRR